MKSFDEYTLDSNRLLLVDGLNLAFRWMHYKSLDFSQDYINTVYSIAQSYKCGRIVIVTDYGQCKYRTNIFPEYKGNRKEKRAQQSDEEKQFFEDFFKELDRTYEELKNDDVPVFKYSNIEADDLAAFIVNNRENFGLDHIWLISSDRDWDLLIEDRVSRFSYHPRKEVTKINWNDNYEIPIDKYLDFKILTGDKGDNVPGITQIGPKRAAGLIEEFGSVKTLSKNLPLKRKYKYIQNLNNNAEVLILNEKLFNIRGYCDYILGEEIRDEIYKELSND